MFGNLARNPRKLWGGVRGGVSATFLFFKVLLNQWDAQTIRWDHDPPFSLRLAAMQAFFMSEVLLGVSLGATPEKVITLKWRDFS
jgi:hypothetical protein